MKTSFTLILSLLLASTAAFAQGGGSGGTRGGNGVGSTSQEVIDAIQELPDAVVNLRGRIWDAWAHKRIENPRIATALDRMYLYSRIYSDTALGATKYFPSLNASCRWGSFPDQDAITIKQPQAEICFNVPRLTRFPAGALREQLLSLVFHEHLHHFQTGTSPGEDETEGKELQDFLLRTPELLIGSSDAKRLTQLIYAIVHYTSSALDHAARSQKATVCFSLGEMSGQRYRLEEKLVELRQRPTPSLPEATLSAADRLSCSIADLSGFCGASVYYMGSRVWHGRVGNGDVQELRRSLEAIKSEAERLQTALEATPLP
jgi:hypothetical protein